MGESSYATGGLLLGDLQIPEVRSYALDLSPPGVRGIRDTHVLFGG